jgi:hypothetical protein
VAGAGPSGDWWQDESGRWHQGPRPADAPTATSASPGPAPPVEREPRPRRRRWWLWLLALVAAFIVGVGLGTTGESTETLTSTSTVTSTETTTVEADPATVTSTTVRVATRIRPPPSSGVQVSYGDWEGMFRIHGATVQSESFLDDYSGKVLGQFEYLGGSDCDRLGYVAVQATFFNSAGRIVGTGLWNSDTAPEGVRLPMEVSGLDLTEPASRAELVVTSASCD